MRPDTGPRVYLQSVDSGDPQPVTLRARTVGLPSLRMVRSS